MSNRYKGGVISATPPTTTGGNDGVASGAWTLEQQMQAQAAGLWPNQPIFYIEDVFSTYLYTGTGAAQTITNGINLSGKGGLVWTKSRTSAYWHTWFDTVRGNTKVLYSNSTSGQDTLTNTITSFNSTGYTLGVDSNGGNNASGENFVSWTFREQPKFFDVVTFTSNASGGATFSHNLGSVPGCLIVKSTANAEDWYVWHRGTTGGFGARALFLNLTMAEFNLGYTTTATSTSVTIPDVLGNPTAPYVAYLFAHDAGGFGLTGTDNVISCGSYYNSGSAPVNVTLGYEPQWILIKKTDSAQNWFLMDTMRGDSLTAQNLLKPNTSDAETVNAGAPGYPAPTATGFTTFLGAEGTFIYIAIRRGPMKVPTVGTSVFAPVINTGNDSATTITSNFPVDLAFRTTRNVGIGKSEWDRLRGTVVLETNTTAAESSNSSITLDNSTGINVAAGFNGIYNFINWMFRRAPGFFDEVCYVGTGANRTVTHNLTVAPELMLIKNRTTATSWVGYCAALTATQVLVLNSNAAPTTNAFVFLNTEPTSTVFTVGAATSGANENGANIVAYLFATCAGVSKVGSYTGTGAAQTINCGFTSGSRFVMIKRTDSTGDWYVWDSARGIIPSNDPYLLINSTAAETTGTDYVDTTNVGFDITSTAPAAINANGGTYIFLAIA
jgi:hypothetical protein